MSELNKLEHSNDDNVDARHREMRRGSVVAKHRSSVQSTCAPPRAENCERSELEESFADGGDAVVKIAYDRYGAMVYTFCRRTVGHDDATELTQDVFVAAWRSQRSYDPSRGGLGGWLMAIARNKAIDHLRRQGRRPLIDVGGNDADHASRRSRQRRGDRKSDPAGGSTRRARAAGAAGGGARIPTRPHPRTDRRKDPTATRHREERRPAQPARLATRTRRPHERSDP